MKIDSFECRIKAIEGKIQTIISSTKKGVPEDVFVLLYLAYFNRRSELYQNPKRIS